MTVINVCAEEDEEDTAAQPACLTDVQGPKGFSLVKAGFRF